MQNLSKPQPSRSRQRLLALRAQQHRYALNLPEQLLWQAVAGARLGVYFKRQVPVAGRYIVDMLAPAIGLVVEVDGRCHERRRRADARRDEKLRRLGYSVLRVEAALVLHDLGAAVGLVRREVGRLCSAVG